MSTYKISSRTDYSPMFHQEVTATILELTEGLFVMYHVLVQNMEGMRLGLPSIHTDINEAIQYTKKAF